MASHVDDARKFETGATRSGDRGKLDFEGAMSPLVVKAFGEYMNFCRHMPDGSERASDNWQKGIPGDAYMKSAFRHFVDWWMWHRTDDDEINIVFTLCAILFNVQGYLHEILDGQPRDVIEVTLKRANDERERSKSPRQPQ